MRAGLDLTSLIDALELGHKGSIPELCEDLIGPEKNRYLVRSAHDGNLLLGSKLITIVPGNPLKRSLPTVQAVIVLFDADSGQLLHTLLDPTLDSNPELDTESFGTVASSVAVWGDKLFIADDRDDNLHGDEVGAVFLFNRV